MAFIEGNEESRTWYCMLRKVKILFEWSILRLMVFIAVMLRKSDNLFECFYIEIDGFIEGIRGVERGTACSETVKTAQPDASPGPNRVNIYKPNKKWQMATRRSGRPRPMV
jgi:hypothetical protein